MTTEQLLEKCIRDRMDSEAEWMRKYTDRRMEVEELNKDLASARAANKSMYERILRLEADAEARERRHIETIQALRRELAGVMPD